jgi:serine-type D-Ala-D-Ala carboxypeptidase (penicillin-binding protein 5/6)
MWIKVLFSTMIVSIAGIGILQAVSVYATNTKVAPLSVVEIKQPPVTPLVYTPPFPQVDILAHGAYLGTVDLVSGTMTPLYVKNEHEILPIASISKLITAYVSSQNRSLKDRFTITQWAVSGPWPSRKFQVGDTYILRELLEASLVESNNDAARVLATSLGERKFVQNMNLAASALALSETSFFSADGTDRVVANETVTNTSSAHDIAQLIVNLHRYSPDLLAVTTQPQVQISDVTGKKVFTAYSTNKLMSFFSDGYTLLGGKTGTSEIERKHLVLLFTDFKGTAYVSVILDSKDNFKDMQMLLDTLLLHTQANS